VGAIVGVFVGVAVGTVGVGGGGSGVAVAVGGTKMATLVGGSVCATVGVARFAGAGVVAGADEHATANETRMSASVSDTTLFIDPPRE
jgi:hypothetical protein